MNKTKIIIGQNFLTSEYFAFREHQFTKAQGYGETPEEAKRDLLKKEKLAAMRPEELNINIKMTKDKIYYGVDGAETAEYLTDEYNLQESFENFIAYFLPNFNDEEDELIGIGEIL